MILFTAVAGSGQCVSTARLISTRTSQPNLISGPVAWSGTVLGVAKRQEGSATAVWFAGYNQALDTLVPDRLVANDARDIISLHWTGTEFGLFYRTPAQRMHLQRISMTGEPIGGPIPITPGRTVYASDEIDIEWSSAADAYVVVRDISQGTQRGLWATYVSRDGTHRSDRRLPVFAAPQTNLSLSVTLAGTAGVFYQDVNRGLSLVTFTETSTPFALGVADESGTHIESAAQGNLYVVVQSVENEDDDKTEIRWLVVDTSHNVVVPDSLLLEGVGADVYPLALVATDDELALAYIDAPNRAEPGDKTYRLFRFTIDGTPLTNTTFAAADLGSASRSESRYDFVWTGSAYLQAAFRESSDRLNSHLLRFCPLRASIAADVAVGRPGQPIVFTAFPQGGAPSYTYEWTFEDPTRIFRTQSVTRTYAKSGTYVARLTVTDTAGAKYVTTYTFRVVDVVGKRRAARH